MRRKIFIGFLAIVVFCLIQARPKSPGGSSLGAVQSIERQPDGLLVQCESGMVKVSEAGPGIIRVQATANKSFDPLPSFAVLPDAGKPKLPEVVSDDDPVQLKSGQAMVEIFRTPLKIRFRGPGGDLQAEDAQGVIVQGGQISCEKIMPADEHYYGLGEKTRHLDKRGDRLVMWNTDNSYGTDTDPLYQSIPFFMALRQGRAYGIFFDNTFKTTFDMGASNAGSYTFAAAGGDMNYYFIAGPKPRDVLERYTSLTGRMPLPPLWSLGYQQSRWSYINEAQVKEIAAGFRSRDLPCDVIYLDIDYMEAWKAFTWNSARFPDPGKMMADLLKQGFHVVTIIDPGVKVEPGYKVYDEGIQNGYFCKRPNNEYFQAKVWPGNCYFPDFLRPEVREWWGGLHKSYMDYGVSGIWNDMNEPAGWKQSVRMGDIRLSNARNMDWSMVHGTQPDQLPHDRIHNVYGFLMDQGTREGLLKLKPDQRPFLLTRAGFAGVQRVSAVWTGDNSSEWKHLGLSLPMLLNLGLSGVSFVGADIGGFNGSPSAELFARWMEAGSFYPFCRNHTSTHTAGQEPWNFGDEVQDISQEYLNLRYRLLPYTYALFEESTRTGWPVMRPMLFEYPDDARFIGTEDEFMWGQFMLVAPVTEKGMTDKSVALPEGKWIGFNNDTVHQGPGSVQIPAGTGFMPVLVRSGAIIPTAPLMPHVGAKPWDPITVEIYPDNVETSFTMYEDDGQSLAYQSGNFRRTPLTCRMGQDKLEFRIGAREGKFEPPASGATRSLILRFHLVSRAVQAVQAERAGKTEEYAASKWTYDSARQLLIIELKDDGQPVTLSAQ